MNTDQILTDSIEKMGVWISRHPSGAVVVTCNGERMEIFPHEKSWSYRIFEGRLVNPYKTGFHLRADVQKFVHEIRIWTWNLGVEHGVL